ncbi:MAG TPA: hypothetical protein VIK89_04500 [Cytophagaceae bacterium]
MTKVQNSCQSGKQESYVFSETSELVVPTTPIQEQKPKEITWKERNQQRFSQFLQKHNLETITNTLFDVTLHLNTHTSGIPSESHIKKASNATNEITNIILNFRFIVNNDTDGFYFEELNDCWRASEAIQFILEFCITQYTDSGYLLDREHIFFLMDLFEFLSMAN